MRVVNGFPFDVAAEVELRRDSGPAMVAAWPRGEPERGELLVFAEADEPPRPGALALVGPGSCRSRRPVLYAWAPATFAAATLAGDPLEPIWTGASRALFRFDQAARVGAPNAEYAYRIEPASDGERAERLWIEGEVARGVQDAEARTVYAGTPKVRGRQGSGALVQDPGLAWRARGETAWQPLREPMEGAVEVVWRDTASRTLRDRAEMIVLPTNARLVGRAAANHAAHFMLENGGGWQLEAARDPKVCHRTSEAGLEVAFLGAPERTVDLRMSHARHEAIDIRAVFPVAEGGFAGAGEQVYRRNARVVLGALRGAQAFAPGRATLTLELSGKPKSQQARQFEEELPLWSVSGDVARLLSGVGDLDADVVLTIDPGATPLRVGLYAGEVVFDREARTVALRGLDVDVGVVCNIEWRSLLDPSAAGLRRLGAQTWTDTDVGAPLPLPDDLSGPGLVYGRTHGRPVGRPTLVMGALPLRDDAPPLRSASLIGERRAREVTIGAALDGLASEPWAYAELRWMHAMLAALDGVSPVAVDAFRLLWRKPRAALALLLSAESDEERERVWRLDQALPLIWALAPLSAWRAALSQRIAHLESLLAQAGLAETVALALGQVRRECDAIIALEPLLQAPLAAVGFCKAEAITRSHHEIAQEWVRRSAVEIDDRRAGAGRDWTSCFYDDPAVRPQLPALFQRRDIFHSAHWEALEAPCVAALRTADRVTLTEAQRFRVRAAITADPLHFAEAYAAFVAEFAREDARAA